MKAKTDLSTEYVRSLFTYDRRLGELRWRITRSNRAPAGTLAGTIRPDGRRIVNIDGRLYFASRLAWVIVTGEWPPFDIDHRDLDKGNDRWKNLRLATRSQNLFNRGTNRNNTSGYKGVSYDSARGRWWAEVMVNRKRILGRRFATKVEAAAAVAEAREREHGEFARFE
jgi:HNH endonuclease/AP2 domain